MVNLHGSCLCGLIKYSYIGKIGQVLNCHCTECRQWHGAAYRTRVVGNKDDFTWLQGDEYVSRYEAQANSIKTFCKVCGSNLISFYKENDNLIGLPLGGVENGIESGIESESKDGVVAKDFIDVKNLGPECHIFVDSKAKWYEITDDLPQYKTLPEDDGLIHKL